MTKITAVIEPDVVAVTARERHLIHMARELARFLDYKTFGSNDRIMLARELHVALMAYEDVEPQHDLDRADWRKRRDERLQATDPRR